jgi:hypothetical protein
MPMHLGADKGHRSGEAVGNNDGEQHVIHQVHVARGPMLSDQFHSSPAEVSRGSGIFALGVRLPGPVQHHAWS